MSLVSLIVMEPGSAWPGHVGGSENVVTVSEHEEGMLLRIRSIASLPHPSRSESRARRVSISIACRDPVHGDASSKPM